MKNAEMNRQIFEVLLKNAVREDFERELSEFPSEQECEGYDLSQATKKKIEAMIHREYRRAIWHRAGKLVKKIAMILAVVLPVAFGSLLSVEASRNEIFNTIMNWKSDHVDIRYSKEASSAAAFAEQNSGEIAKPQYLPEGFFETQTVRTGVKIETEYQNEKGETILLNQCPLSEAGTIAVDTKYTTRREVKINGETASLFVSNNPGQKSYLIWKTHSSSYLLSSEIAWDQLVKIAESVQ